MFNKRAFVWLLFKKEVLFFILGLIIGIILMYLTVKGVIPVDLGLCSVAK